MSQIPPGRHDMHAQPQKKGLGTVVVAFIIIVVGGGFVLTVCGGLLSGVTLVATGQARDAARTLKSQTQMAALVQAFRAYASDNNGYLPPAATWDLALGTYGVTSGPGGMIDSPQIEGAGNEMIYSPPAGTEANGLVKLSDIRTPSTWILIREDEARLGPNQMIVVGYGDGTVKALAKEQLAAELARQAGGN